ncbi:MAG: hypothetical protein MZV63_22580 [Marinilabiliales bacterium]|nr:hypothetical protein [Marinilabiliales bacterium]
MRKGRRCMRRLRWTSTISTSRAWSASTAAARWSHELRSTIIKETGLPISMGLSVNKTVSKIAAGEAKPNGEKEVAQQYGPPLP